MDGLSEIGAASAFAVIMLREVFGFVQKMRETKKGASKSEEETRRQFAQEEILKRIEERAMGTQESLESIEKNLSVNHTVHTELTRAQGILLDALTELRKQVQTMGRQTEELYKWHDRDDEEGVKIWYRRSALEKAIDRLTGTLGTQNGVLQGVADRMADMAADVKLLQSAE